MLHSDAIHNACVDTCGVAQFGCIIPTSPVMAVHHSCSGGGSGENAGDGAGGPAGLGGSGGSGDVACCGGVR